MVVRIHVGDALATLRTLESESVQCVVTSPPYFQLRRYLDPGDPNAALEMGSEQTPAEFIAALVEVFREVKRVLRHDGVAFVNLGDSYSGSGKGPTGQNGIQNAETRQGFGSGYWSECRACGGSGQAHCMAGAGRGPGHDANGTGRGPDALAGPSCEACQGEGRVFRSGGRKSKTEGTAGIPAKNLLLIPERFAIAMQEAGWWVRQEIVWSKASCMPESVRDRFTSAWEPIWMFSKSARYYFDQEAVRQTATMAPQRRMTPHPIGRGPAQQNGVNPLRDDPIQDAPAGGANMRNVWHLPPEPSREAHYASFVTEIPRRCILAGTSQAGACPACGAPWVRVVERKRIYGPKDRGATNKVHHLAPQAPARNGEARAGDVSVSTLGWQPGCSCSRTSPDGTMLRDIVREWFGGNEAVYRLWEGNARKAGKVGAYEILLPDVRGTGVEGCTAVAGDGVQEGQHPAGLSGRQDDGQEGVRVHPHPGSPDGESERLRTGTSPGLGKGARGRGDSEGTGDSSPERNPERQSPGELDRATPQGTRDLPSHQGCAGETPPGGSRASGAQGGDGPYLIPYPARPCVVLDIFGGSGTTGLVADRLGRDAILIELNPTYADLARKRIERDAGGLFGEAVTVEPVATQLDLLAAVPDPRSTAAGGGAA